jgi:hypothetical protein
MWKHDLQLVKPKGLPEEVISPLTNRTQSVFPILVAGNDNRFGSSSFVEDSAQGPKSFVHVSWVRWHAVVEPHHNLERRRVFVVRLVRNVAVETGTRGRWCPSGWPPTCLIPSRGLSLWMIGP